MRKLALLMLVVEMLGVERSNRGSRSVGGRLGRTVCQRRPIRLNPRRPVDCSVVAVPGRVCEDVTLSYVEVV